MENDNAPLKFDIAQREGTPGYLFLYFSVLQKFADLISNPNFEPSHTQITLLSSFIISLIPEKEIRDRIRAEMKAEIDKELSKIESSAEKTTARNEIIVRHIGSAVDFIDEHIGISEKNKLGYV